MNNLSAVSEKNFNLDQQRLKLLTQESPQTLETYIAGQHCTVKILIPNYLSQLQRFYRQHGFSNIETAKQLSGIDYQFQHFGLEIHFHQPNELCLHDENLNLDEGIKQLIELFGPVIIKNAYLTIETRDIGHRNRFPHLKFHYDRSPGQKTIYSVYTRNPFDTEQVKPRISSTLFIPNNNNAVVEFLVFMSR